MGRKHHISRDGYDKLRLEWLDLKDVKRPEMQNQVTVAAAEGDRSENAAYTYGKMRLREIDRRLRYLDRMLQDAVVVDEVAHDGSIRFGAIVRMQNRGNGREVEYTLVGPVEMDAVNGRISISSPLGTQLQGKRVGDTVEVPTPRGLNQFEVLEVRYP